MTQFEITSKAGATFGVYEGETAKDAFLAMLRDSGDEAAYGAEAGTEDDWIIEAVTVPTLTDELRRQLLRDLDLAGSHGDKAGAEVIENALAGDADALAEYLSWPGADE